ncbi:C40 family peptidase [Ancylomarina sp. YFZ004]
MFKQVLFLILTVLTIASCSTKRHISKQNTDKAIHIKTKEKVEVQVQKKQLDSTDNLKTQNPKKKTSVKHKLETHYNKYKAVPYKYGGTSTKGFDCSGFVQFTYKNVFNIRLPRTTRLMLKVGTPIKKSQLRIGDLVLFRTSKRYRHVGIFMGDNQFMHVSTKKGLKKSKLNNPYWLKRYLASRRIF